MTIGSYLLLVVCLGCSSHGKSDDPLASQKSEPADSQGGEVSIRSSQEVESPKPILDDRGNQPIPPNQDVEPAPSTPPKKVYTEADLHKNNTVLLLAMPPDIRARTLMRFLREDLTADEMDSAVRFGMEHDHLYQTMIQRRASILDEAVYGDDTTIQMRRLKIDIFETSDRIRSLAYTKFLTQEKQAAKKLRRDEAAKLTDKWRKKDDKK